MSRDSQFFCSGLRGGPGHVDCWLLGNLKEIPMQRRNKVEGEGSYSGARDYNERTKKFIKSGKVEKAARASAPRSEGEKHAMQKAERIGRSRAKK
jgi:hypothetical protein